MREKAYKLFFSRVAANVLDIEICEGLVPGWAMEAIAAVRVDVEGTWADVTKCPGKSNGG